MCFGFGAWAVTVMTLNPIRAAAAAQGANKDFFDIESRRLYYKELPDASPLAFVREDAHVPKFDSVVGLALKTDHAGSVRAVVGIEQFRAVEDDYEVIA